jgi:hypothetical protein
MFIYFLVGWLPEELLLKRQGPSPLHFSVCVLIEQVRSMSCFYYMARLL